MNKDGSISVTDLMAELQANPEWMARDRARKAKQEATKLRFSTEEKPIVDDLTKVGIVVRSVWDLVNTNVRYARAIPILLDHLKKHYHACIRNGIIRVLTTSDARGIAGDALLSELRHEHEFENRWVLANALTVVADQSNRFEIEALLNDSTYEDVSERLEEALKAL